MACSTLIFHGMSMAVDYSLKKTGISQVYWSIASRESRAGHGQPFGLLPATPGIPAIWLGWKKRGQPAENSSLEARIHNCGRLEQPLLWKNIMAHMSNVDSQASDSMQNWKNPPEQSHLSKELKAYPNMSNPNGSAGMIKVYDDVNLGFINHQVV